jgi:hypothetical protein
VLWLDGKKPLDENRTGDLGKENPPFARLPIDSALPSRTGSVAGVLTQKERGGRCCSFRHGVSRTVSAGLVAPSAAMCVSAYAFPSQKPPALGIVTKALSVNKTAVPLLNLQGRF